MATATDELREEVLARLRTDWPWYARHFLRIVNKRSHEVDFEPNAAQLALDEALEEQRQAGKPQRAIVLKARQVGISTYAQGKLIQRTTLNANHSAIVVAHDLDTGGKLYKMGEKMYGKLPEDEELPLKPKLGHHRRARHLNFSDRALEAWTHGSGGLNSEYLVSTAGEPESGRGGTYRSVHGCFPADTPVLCEDGVVKLASEVRVGDQVVTHSGVLAPISAVSTRPNQDEMVVVTPWLGGPVRLTPNHEVWVRPGYWKRADVLTVSDAVAMPVRPITREITELPTEQVQRVGQTGGRQRKGGGEPIPLNEETGFALGYYLAEGHIFAGPSETPAGIVFTRDQGETRFVDRACAALEPWITSRRTDERPESRTVADTTYGAAVADCIATHFGRGAERRIPDWVFGAGQEFCYGVLLGYLAGDGSKVYGAKGDSYDCPTVCATSIRASLVTQVRDIAAALGYGWGGISHRPAGVHYGRNCKEAWTVKWSGDAARDLRARLGLGDASTRGRGWIQKYKIEDGTVWMKIRKIEKANPDEEVFDFEVDHPDHSFRTLHFAISNSEVAFWPDISGKLDALLSGMPDDEDTLVVLESTANGDNAFKDWWSDAVEGRSDFIAFFWPWWKQEEYSLPFANDHEREEFAAEVGEGTVGEDEPRMLNPGPLDTISKERVPLTLEQLHWRRKTIANKLGGRVDRFKQEFPTTPEEAFLATGQRVFDPYLVQGLLEDVEHTDPRMPSSEHPGPDKGRFKAKTRKLRESKRAGRVEVPEDPLWTPRSKLEVGEAAGWKLWLADEPKDKKTKKLTGDYVIAVDPSGGQLNETDEPDYHGVQVGNHRTQDQVAAYRSRVDPDLLAEEVYLAALFFNRAWVAIEVTGGYGLPVARRLWLDYRYGRMYVRHSHDRQRERQEDRLGWSTDSKTKPIMVAGLAEQLREGTHGIRDRETALEMQTYVRDDRGRTAAEPGKYDDCIESYMILKQVMRELPIRPTREGRKNTYGAPSKRYPNRS